MNFLPSWFVVLLSSKICPARATFLVLKIPDSAVLHLGYEFNHLSVRQWGAQLPAKVRMRAI